MLILLSRTEPNESTGYSRNCYEILHLALDSVDGSSPLSMIHSSWRHLEPFRERRLIWEGLLLNPGQSRSDMNTSKCISFNRSAFVIFSNPDHPQLLHVIWFCCYNDTACWIPSRQSAQLSGRLMSGSLFRQKLLPRSCLPYQSSPIPASLHCSQRHTTHTCRFPHQVYCKHSLFSPEQHFHQVWATLGLSVVSSAFPKRRASCQSTACYNCLLQLLLLDPKCLWPGQTLTWKSSRSFASCMAVDHLLVQKWGLSGCSCCSTSRPPRPLNPPSNLLTQKPSQKLNMI